jgi:hypothetical protein
MGPARRSVYERMMDKFEPIPFSGCWIWVGARYRLGYGQIGRGGIGGGVFLAHRLFYEKYKGPIPEGMELDHKCREPSCVNPDHLEAVTHRENVRRGKAMQNGYWWRNRTHCPSGHPYSEENTYIRPGGERCCRVCRQTSQKLQDAKRRAETAARRNVRNRYPTRKVT